MTTLPIIVWLWPEQDKIRAWTPSHTCILSAVSPGLRDLRLSDRNLRDNLESIALKQALHLDLADFLIAVLAIGQPVQLRLAHGLPDAWRDFPYERLQHEGQPLMGRIVVAREMPFPVDADGALTTAKALVLNLWPRDEAIQPVEVENLRRGRPYLHIERSRKVADRIMVSHDLEDYGLLIVVAHGSEGRFEAPFRLAGDMGWFLPTGRGLPALVILLACGSEDGNLLAYGRELLAAGARAVLAPRGKLDARGASEFLQGFLSDWLDQGLSVAEALRRGQLADQDQNKRYGAQRLYLLGEAGLRWGVTDDPSYATTEELKARSRQELQETTPPVALPAWCERLTRQHYQRYGSLSEVRLAVDEAEEAPLLRRLYPVVESLSRLTQS
ncbi:MAG: CHAT domain-containing protein, partial [Pseudomonadota bacterium]